jgi:hypothetical protein
MDQIQHAVRMFTGITSMPIALELLPEREQYYMHMLEALLVVIYTTDAVGKITYYNQAATDPAAALSSAAMNGASPGVCTIPTARPCRMMNVRWLGS